MTTMGPLHTDHFSLGQSGATVSLVREFDSSSPNPGFTQKVRKTNVIDPSRLRIQRLLQEEAQTSGYLEPIRVPLILGKPAEDCFEMEFVSGGTVANLLERLSPKDLVLIGDSIFSYLTGESTEGNDLAIVDNQALHAKLVRLSRNAVILRKLGPNTVENFCQLLERHLLSSPPLAALHHGDFSLDNLLFGHTDPRAVSLESASEERFNQSVLWAIDFLDEPLGSRLADFGRIFLDLEFGWWGHSFESSNTRMARLWLRSRVLDAASRVGLSSSTLLASSAFSALRIIPYTESPFRLGRLMNVIRIAQERLR